MPYKLLADATVIFHFLWILFLIFGGWWGRRNRLVKYLHIAGLVFVFFVETGDLFCPLTYLEVWLRQMSSHPFYAVSFIVHYLEQFIYITLPRWIIVFLTFLLCGLNALLYLHKPPQGKH
jgi:hypothetical protein